MAQLDEGQLLQRMLNTSDRERSTATKKQSMELAKAEKRQVELDRVFFKLYEDWAADRITERNFHTLSEKYQTEQEELTERVERLQAELHEERQMEDNAKNWIALIKQYANPTELTAEMLNALMEKIVVHEAVKVPDGTREQEIEIYYRFIGKIDG